MRSDDNAPGRVVALVVLVVLTAAALRGHFPGTEPGRKEPLVSERASMIGVVALLSVSLAIVAVAIVSTMRRRDRAPRPRGHSLPASPGDGQKPRFRVLLIGLAVMVVWVLVILMLSQWIQLQEVDQQRAPRSPSDGDAAENPDAPAPPAPSDFGDDMFRYMTAATIVLVVLLAVGMVIALRRRPRDLRVYASVDEGGAESAESPESQTLVRAAELGLAEIADRDREPREAIIACYAAMERALENAPDAVPQDSDTPSEVLARAVDHHALHAGSANELVDLFVEARFSTHVMTEEHRAAAVRALRRVLAELRTADMGARV